MFELKEAQKKKTTLTTHSHAHTTSNLYDTTVPQAFAAEPADWNDFCHQFPLLGNETGKNVTIKKKTAYKEWKENPKTCYHVRAHKSLAQHLFLIVLFLVSKHFIIPCKARRISQPCIQTG